MASGWLGGCWPPTWWWPGSGSPRGSNLRWRPVWMSMTACWWTAVSAPRRPASSPPATWRDHVTACGSSTGTLPARPESAPPWRCWTNHFRRVARHGSQRGRRDHAGRPRHGHQLGRGRRDAELVRLRHRRRLVQLAIVDGAVEVEAARRLIEEAGTPQNAALPVGHDVIAARLEALAAGPVDIRRPPILVT